MKVALRRAAQSDAAAIKDLIRRVRINPLSLDWRRFWVAVNEDGRMTGCGQLKPHGDGTLELASIAVEPALQGQGIGKALIEKLIEEHRDSGSAQPLYLTCRPRMVPYYLRYRFQLVEEDQLPPYFRRIYRLAGWLKRLFPRMDAPAVMKRDDFSEG